MGRLRKRARRLAAAELAGKPAHAGREAAHVDPPPRPHGAKDKGRSEAIGDSPGEIAGKEGQSAARDSPGTGDPDFASLLSKWPQPLHRDNFPLVLMWSPKAGCTTFVKWFLFHTGELEDALIFHRWVHKYRQKVIYNGFEYFAKTAALFTERRRPVVKLVRDPWRRAVSSYLQMAQSRKLGSDEWSARTRADLLALIGEPPDRPAMSFREFARALTLRSVVQGTINPHIAQQYSEGEDAFAVRVVKLEDFAREIRRIEQDYGLAAAPLDALSQSRHHHGDVRRFIAGAADLQIGLETFPRGDSPSHESFYDEETRHLIGVAFRRDIERYGYGGG